MYCIAKSRLPPAGCSMWNSHWVLATDTDMHARAQPVSSMDACFFLLLPELGWTGLGDIAKPRRRGAQKARRNGLCCARVVPASIPHCRCPKQAAVLTVGPMSAGKTSREGHHNEAFGTGMP
jgi:hypothetical protein